MIEQNKKIFCLNVDFRVLDIARDALPSGDICFVPKFYNIFQISYSKNLKLMSDKYKYLVIRALARSR